MSRLATPKPNFYGPIAKRLPRCVKDASHSSGVAQEMVDTGHELCRRYQGANK
jgi:hypothetical protein